MSTFACVVREVGPGDRQWLPLNEVSGRDGAPWYNNETLYWADWSFHPERCGPSGSHTRTICLPRGEVKPFKPFVQRHIDNEIRFVPLAEAGQLQPGEKVFGGDFKRVNRCGCNHSVWALKKDCEAVCLTTCRC